MSKKLTFIEKFENDLKALTKFLVGEQKVKAKKRVNPKDAKIELNQEEIK
tara:strand:- start:2364 stop:2513 length:150 start_codon:yes stop_codon:yes gene_type:complete